MIFETWKKKKKLLISLWESPLITNCFQIYDNRHFKNQSINILFFKLIAYPPSWNKFLKVKENGGGEDFSITSS